MPGDHDLARPPRLCRVCCYSSIPEAAPSRAAHAGRADDGNARDKNDTELCRTACPDPARGPRGDDGRARLAAGPAAPGRRQPVPQPLLARRLPHHARHGPPRGDGRAGARGARRALSAALLPQADGRRDRPPHRARQRTRPHAGAGADRPAERQGKRISPRRCGASTSGAWPQASAASAATCRAPACRSATHGACAPRRRCCWSTAFAFSFGPLGGRLGDGFQAHAALRDHAAAHRRLGDAAGLYRQGAGLPDRRQPTSADGRVPSPCRKAANCRCA